MSTETAQIKELAKANDELSEAITALAVMAQDYEVKRKEAQQRVTMAQARVHARISILGKS